MGAHWYESNGESTGEGSEWQHSLLLEVVLSRASRLASRERALVVTLSGMDAGVSRQVSAGRESLVTSCAYVFLFRCGWFGCVTGR